MVRPSIKALPERLAAVARAACERIAQGGGRGWLVGGAVRDLALDVTPHDVDLASALPPETVEALFPRAIPVGRAYGTLVLVIDGLELQHTSFRGEGVYGDARRPDRVSYGKTLEEDSRRRDFTCNALYLDPLTDELEDPQGGLRDLDARRLRCVGEAGERFREDGLRILRLARLAAGFGLEVERGTREAAAESVDSLRGVSPERVTGELERLQERPGTARALAILEDVGALGAILERFLGEQAPRGDLRRRALARLGAMGEPLRLAEVLAVLLETLDESALRRALDRLRASRRLAKDVLDVRKGVEQVRSLGDGAVRCADRVRLVRGEPWHSVRRIATVSGAEEPARRLEELRLALGPGELFPEALLSSRDLARAGIPRGPRWGELLLELEDAQLEGRLTSRADALRWLASRN